MTSTKTIGSILVRCPNWIGDAIMAVPAMHELSRVFPDAEIVLHTRTWADGLFEDADFVDRIISFERPKSRIKAFSNQIDVLAGHRYDLAVLFTNSLESALVARLAKVPKRIGYNKDLRGLILTDPIPVPEWKGRRHEAFYYLNLAAETEKRFAGTATIPNSVPVRSLPVSDKRRSAARRLLETSGMDLSRKVIAVGAGSTNSMAKRWGTAKFSRLCDLLVSELSAQIVLVGSEAEREVAEELKQLAKVSLTDLTGKTTIAEAAALLSVVDLLVSNDMGLAHVAPAVGTPTAVIFGPTDPVTTRPFSENAVVIMHNVECAPCMLRECPIDHRCMERISPEEVLKVCGGMLYPPVAEEYEQSN